MVKHVRECPERMLTCLLSAGQPVAAAWVAKLLLRAAMASDLFLGTLLGTVEACMSHQPTQQVLLEANIVVAVGFHQRHPPSSRMSQSQKVHQA